MAVQKNEKHIEDMVEVKGKIERIEHHLKLLKDGQIISDDVHRENGKKLDLILNTFTDSPFNADNGFVKRLNKTEKIVDNHALYWQIAVGVLGSTSVLIVIVKIIMKL